MVSVADVTSSITKTLTLEGEEIAKLTKTLDSEQITKLIDIIVNRKGNILLTGCGTSAMAAKKTMHTLNVIGVPAFFLSPADATNGSLGAVGANDTVIIITKGGTTRELLAFTPNLQEKGCTIVTVTEKTESPLAKAADLVVYVHVDHEADTFNMLATTSTLGVIATFDAVAIAIMEISHFSKGQFLENHPSGDVGDRLKAHED
ncbi:SIS domain-containing protein [Bifidobacterium aquikefiricola]|uniref:SIS domain-containing protein n=1 Tax=Bifidobacterium aquikefiricola TaxID=3059038 RepID=A0AB39U6B4_9BIFI